ncbi:MAG: PD40 domain-containing protein [Acidobacteria bacterium]|nr:PD40 domain-containing protein [Acidobacteriota bacterium]
MPTLGTQVRPGAPAPLSLRVALTLALGVAAFHAAEPPSLGLPQETHLDNVRQLTFAGENAEAYFSADNRYLIYQARGEGVPCDRIYILKIPEPGEELAPLQVSNGQGKATCAYFFPDEKHILYSSTHLAGPACPPPPDYSRGYAWPVYADYDIFIAARDGSGLLRLTATPGYDAEATLSPDGQKIVFTSARDGDLDIYVMDADGSNLRRLTHELGYDGGPFFSPDGQKIVYRAHHPTDPAEIEDYKALLARNLLRPTRLEIWVMEADGSNQHPVTSNGAANFAPFWHPDGGRIIFASNLAGPGSRPPAGRAGNFDLYLVNLDGTGLERVTFSEVFDGFPMFSSDGKRLVWASNRQPEAGAPGAHNARRPGDTNIFLADWVE